MTSQMTRFLSILFKDALLSGKNYGKELILRAFAAIQQTPRHDISFSGFSARRGGFYDLHLRKRAFQALHELVERLALERLHDENAVRLQGLGAKIDRVARQLERPGLVDEGNSRQVRRDVGQHDIRF